MYNIGINMGDVRWKVGDTPEIYFMQAIEYVCVCVCVCVCVSSAVLSFGPGGVSRSLGLD